MIITKQSKKIRNNGIFSVLVKAKNFSSSSLSVIRAAEKEETELRIISYLCRSPPIPFSN